MLVNNFEIIKPYLPAVQQAELWRRFIPKADIQIFKGAGHLVLDEKQETVDAVQRFLT